MAVSKHRKDFKVKKKKRTIQKQKEKEMQNAEKAKPVNYTYHKDRTTVEVPLQAWQMLSYAASQLEPIGAFVSVMEQLSQQQKDEGVLMPIYADDLEPIPGKFGPKGEQQYKLKDAFWNRGKSPILEIEKPSIVMADGKTLFKSEDAADVAPPQEQTQSLIESPPSMPFTEAQPTV